jgi:hypothetical protein
MSVYPAGWYPFTPAGSGPPPAATLYFLEFGSPAPLVGERYRVTARLPAGTTLASDVAVTLGGTNLQYAATQGGALGSPGTLTIAASTGTGAAYWSPVAEGPVTPSATNVGGLSDPAPATLTASAPTSGGGTAISDADVTRIASAVFVQAGQTPIPAAIDEQTLAGTVTSSVVAAVGTIGFDVATVLSATPTGFTATVRDAAGNVINSGSSGFKGMNAIPQAGKNFRRTITSHQFANGVHTFAIADDNPWPSDGIPPTSSRVILG